MHDGYDAPEDIGDVQSIDVDGAFDPSFGVVRAVDGARRSYPDLSEGPIQNGWCAKCGTTVCSCPWRI